MFILAHIFYIVLLILGPQLFWQKMSPTILSARFLLSFLNKLLAGTCFRNIFRATLSLPGSHSVNR